MQAPKLSDLREAISELESIPGRYYQLLDITNLIQEAHDYIEATQTDLNKLNTAFTKENSFNSESLDQAIVTILEHRNHA